MNLFRTKSVELLDGVSLSPKFSLGHKSLLGLVMQDMQGMTSSLYKTDMRISGRLGALGTSVRVIPGPTSEAAILHSYRIQRQLGGRGPRMSLELRVEGDPSNWSLLEDAVTVVQVDPERGLHGTLAEATALHCETDGELARSTGELSEITNGFLERVMNINLGKSSS